MTFEGSPLLKENNVLTRSYQVSLILSLDFEWIFK